MTHATRDSDGQLTLWAALLAAVSITFFVSWPAMLDLGDKWINNEAYSHGFVLLFVAIFLGLQRLPTIPPTATPSRWFLPILTASLLFILVARLSELHVVAQYGLMGVLGAMVLGLWGWRGVQALFIPLLLLFLAVPMPGYLEVNLTAELKLISSKVGAGLLQQIGVPVFSEGNIIDLGSYRLQVADACSGLNYMIPLIAIGVMVAGFLNTTIWRRVTVVLLTIPLTVAMNIVRIAVAGLLVKYVGPETAEGFIHDFEGWMVFVASLGLFLPMVALVLRIGPGPSTLKEAFVVDFSLPSLAQFSLSTKARRNLYIGLTSMVLALAVVLFLQEKQKTIPQRVPFEVFPKLLGQWTGSLGVLDDQTIDSLKLTDYVWGSYQSAAHTAPVDLLSTWYAVQTDGATPHSPNICLPGAGWEITTLQRTSVHLENGLEVPLNRALLERQGERMLAYYWFQQRGRLFANEFAMKWYIIQDSVMMNRSDGGMVRLTTRLDGTAADGDARLQAFMTEIWPILPRYLPE